MLRRHRTLLLWLLVAAVPVQAGAAATMALCGPAHHGIVGTAHEQGPGHAHEGGHPEGSHHVGGHHGDGHHPGHEHGAAPGDAQPGDQAPAIDPAEDGRPAASKCSACASCCGALALTSAAPTLSAPDLSSVPPEAASAGVQHHAADALERPPRSSRA